MYRVGVVLIIASFVALSAGSSVKESLTYDEIFYQEEGLSILTKGQYLDPYNPPLYKILTAVPYSPFWKRMIITVLGSILIYAIYKTARCRFGQSAGFVALVLAAFESTILAHSHYITGDIAFTLFFFLFVLSLPRSTLVSGLLLGVSMATKGPGIIFGLAVMAIFYRELSVKKILIIFALACAVVWATYGFQMKPVLILSQDPARVSSKMMVRYIPVVNSALRFFSSRPVPLGQYIQTLKNSLIRGATPVPTFFWGNMYPDHRWYFLGGNLLLKLPIVLVVLLCIGLFEKRRRNRRMLGVLVVLFLLMSLSRLMPLVRHALPLYPFAILIASSSVRFARGTYAIVFFCILLVFYVAQTLFSFPHFISYANAFAGTRPYMKLTDSNIDWGQSLPDMEAFVQQKKPLLVLFSYFGRDDAGRYGLLSSVPWGSWKFEQICQFHPVQLPNPGGTTLRAISISNWYGCGYWRLPVFSKDRVIDVVGGSILIF